MKKTRATTAVGVIAATWLVIGALPPRAQELGEIDFPTSGAPAAKGAFLQGAKSLHSFEFAEAGVAFRDAQKADPAFAMAYWGEAMSYNHPLWAEQDLKAARETLERLSPTREGRAAKAPTPKEKAFLEAAERLFYGSDDKLTRDRAYADAMQRMYETYPNDREVATFYALSLLGTVRPGDTGFRRQALAASVAQRVFQENPKHPGAAHFLIHAFDDPDHAPLGLAAARAYASIAPSAPHALHMPSHIFVQLGMWDDVVKSNEVAYAAAIALIKRMNLPEGREDFHTLSWLAYGAEMRGDVEKARESVERAKAAADRNAAAPRLRDGYLSMRARFIVETQQWEKPAGAAPPTAGAQGPDSGAHAGMDHGYNGNADWLFAMSVSAAKLGDLSGAERAQAELRGQRERMAAGPTPYRAKTIEILEKEAAALIALARNQGDAAAQLAKDAAALEATLDKPSGPPDPLKPAAELYGDVLMALNRPKEAAAQYELSLLRTARRTPSLLGSARASAKSGDMTTARRRYTEVASILSNAKPGFAPLAEAQQFLKTTHD